MASAERVLRKFVSDLNAAQTDGTTYAIKNGALVVLPAGPANTDALPEGTTNLYFTGARTLASTLTGFTSSVGTVTAADSILTALQKLQGTKVDKVDGKGLSTNDYTTAEQTKLAGIAAGAQVNTVTSVAARTGDVVLASSDVGLANVNNTSDANKPVSTAQQTALNLKAPIASPTFTGGASVTSGDLTVTRSTQAASAMFNLITDAGQAATISLQTGSSRRWQVIKSADAESGSNVGSDFSIVRYQDNSSYGSVPLIISRATGRTTIAALTVNGDATVAAPFRLGQYTLTTLPSASTYSGYTIDVTNATGGVKQCRSNGANWIVVNTTNIVS